MVAVTADGSGARGVSVTFEARQLFLGLGKALLETVCRQTPPAFEFLLAVALIGVCVFG